MRATAKNTIGLAFYTEMGQSMNLIVDLTNFTMSLIRIGWRDVREREEVNVGCGGMRRRERGRANEGERFRKPFISR